MTWQFDRSDPGERVVQIFRRRDNSFFGYQLKLRGLLVDVQYEITNFDEPGTTRMTGKELMEQGLDITIKDKPAAVVISYKKV